MDFLNTTPPPPPKDCNIIEDDVNKFIFILYLLMFPLALLLNTLVAWVSLRLNSKSSFMVYLKNLVAADLLTTLMIPIRAANQLPTASLGLQIISCRFIDVLFYLGLNISIVLMGLISLDRFFKIVRPCGKRLGQNLTVTKAISAAVWISYLVGSTFPAMILTNQIPTNKTKQEKMCMSMKSQAGQDLHKGVIIFNSLVFCLVCPLIGFCYICIAKRVVWSFQNSKSSNNEAKRRVKARVFLILLVFIICYIPYYCVKLPYAKLQILKNVSCAEISLKLTKDITLLIATSNVCLDPLIYFFLCKGFRKKFLEMSRLGKPSLSNTQKIMDDSHSSEQILRK